MDFKFNKKKLKLAKIGAFHGDFFGPITPLDFPVLALAMKYLNWSCYMSHAFVYTSQ